jgi:sterol desaturase/sphingolipid hydroxylase (fatty acid hydroxylase superfamily)
VKFALPKAYLPAGVLFYGACLLIEHFRPLRRPTQPKLRRVARNLAMGAIGSGTLRLAFYPFLLGLAALTAEKEWGLLQALPLSYPVRVAAGFLLLDYTLYWWHWLNHNVAFLWRFHNAHHADLDLDISTAARFHFGELILSTIPRAVEIAAFGLDPSTVLLYDAAVVVAIHFHHSNIRLPIGLERALSWFMVTPRMHGIHHSIVQRETNSNYSTVFLFWDTLHRTLRLDVPQAEVRIGVAAYRDPSELTLGKILGLPFGPQRPWRLPDGSVPERHVGPGRSRPGRMNA